MRPPLFNLATAAAGTLLIVVSFTFHPSLVLLPAGVLIALLGVTVRFERPPRAQRR
jgi:hypothetical protein